MSNADAIATVTARLQSQLAAASKLWVSTEPLDKLPSPDHSQALNLHLYRVLPNATWRNMDVPWKAKPGEPYHVPLALDLHYLLTATGINQVDAQKNLGVGMQVLHDNPVLDPGGAAVSPFERARISMHTLSLDDMEKLWTGVPSPRLLSVAYEVSVVLIESAKPVRSPLPVLARGTGRPDSIEVLPSLQLYPTIERIEIGRKPFDEWLRRGSRPGRSVAQIDDTIFLYGQGLANVDKAIIRSLMHAEQDPRVVTEFSANDRGALAVELSKATSKIPAGPCSIALQDKLGKLTNAVPFSLAPAITSINPALPLVLPTDATVAFAPPLVDRQAAVLIFANMQLAPQSAAQPGDSSATFRFEKPPLSGDYPFRLRVDGVDSILVDLTKSFDTERPSFSEAFIVKVP